MADTKISAMTTEATPIGTDVFPFIKDPGGTPLNRKTTFDNAWDNFLKAQVEADVKLTECLIVPCSDLTSNLAAGTSKAVFRMPYAFTLTAVRCSVLTAPTGSTIIVDINEAGVTILSTKLTIDASEKTSTTAAAAAVISDTALADDAEITIDIDQVGSTVPGVGLVVTLIGKRT